MINQVTLVGRLTRDPEFKTVNDTCVVKFGLATAGFKKDETDFHNLECWGKSAELVNKYLKKGDMCGTVGGRLVTDVWEKDGVKHSRTKVVAHQIKFGPKRDGASKATASDGEQGLDTIPF